MTRSLDDQEIERLLAATRATLAEWIERLRQQTGDGFPEKVTAFRPEMAVHGRFGKPCPVCGAPVQRIVHAENETNYCAALPDRRPAARRPRAVAAAEGRLAAHARGNGRAEGKSLMGERGGWR